MSRRDRTGDGERGQALLELALVTPILIILVMAIFQFAYVFETQMGLTNAVREAARRAASSPEVDPNWTSGSGSFEAWVQKEMCGDLTAPCDGGLLDENVQAFNPDSLAGDLPTVSFCSYLVGAELNYRVTVSVTYAHPVFFGPLAFATDLADGTGDGQWDLSAEAQMRLENPDAAEGATDPGACT